MTNQQSRTIETAIDVAIAEAKLALPNGNDEQLTEWAMEHLPSFTPDIEQALVDERLMDLDPRSRPGTGRHAPGSNPSRALVVDAIGALHLRKGENMTTEQRFEQMEAQVAALELRDARREAEHVSLLRTYTEMNESREKLLRELDKDYTMLGKAFDKRIDELKARVAGAGGLSKEELLAGFGEVGDVLQLLSDRQVRFASTMLECFRTMCQTDLNGDRQDAETIMKIHERLLQILEIVRVADSRLCRLENLVRPALEGRAKIMAIEA